MTIGSRLLAVLTSEVIARSLIRVKDSTSDLVIVIRDGNADVINDQKDDDTFLVFGPMCDRKMSCYVALSAHPMPMPMPSV